MQNRMLWNKKIVALVMTLLVAGTAPLALLGAELPEMTEEDAPAESNITTLEMSNKQNEAGIAAVAISGKSTPDNAYTSLQVSLTDQAVASGTQLYRLAEYVWKDGVYQPASWVSEVDAWIDVYVAEEGAGRNKADYASPLALVDATQASWTSFYGAMLKDDGKIIDNEAYETFLAMEVISSTEPGAATSGKVIATVGTEEINGQNVPCVTYSHLPIGVYAIVTNYGEQHFNPVVVDVCPERASPTGSFYLKRMFYTSLKDSDATINKYVTVLDDRSISGNPAAAVDMGQTVHFTIEVVPPALYKDRDDYAEPYVFQIEDDPGLVFTDISNLQVSYEYNATVESDGEMINQVRRVPFTFTEGTLNGASLPYYSFTRDQDAEGYLSFDADDAEERGIDPLNGEEYHTVEALVYDNTSADPVNEDDWRYKLCVAPVFTYHSIPMNKDGVDYEGFSFHFNPQAIKAYLKLSGGAITSISKVIIQYDAVVSDYVKMESEENINTATLYYEKNGSLTAPISAEARVYTYGLHVEKMDGDTVLSEYPFYIDGAQFKLYKEVCTFDVTDKKNITMVEGSRMDGVTASYTAEDYENWCGDLGVYYSYAYSEDDKDLVRMFKQVTTARLLGDLGNGMDSLLWDDDYNNAVQGNTTYAGIPRGTFVSVGGANHGITLEGLGPGNYVLVETVKPTGYNRLAEDMLFSIVELDYTEAATKYGGSLLGFKDGTEVDAYYEATGIYKLDVLNYKGLVLPTTGGKGTLIFTMIGMLMMSGIILVVIIQRQNAAMEDLF